MEINEIKRSKDQEIAAFIQKLSSVNEENMNLANQLKNISVNMNNKEEELNKVRKKYQEMISEQDRIKTQLKSFETIEHELAQVTSKSLAAQSRVQELECRLEECDRKYHRDLAELKNVNYQQLEEIKHLKQDLKTEAVKFEKLHADYEFARLELNKMELAKMKADQLEREMYDLKTTKLQRLQDLEVGHKRYSETLEKYENEIKLLNAQMINLVNIQVSS
jgi:chromosome segregation ATPase